MSEPDVLHEARETLSDDVVNGHRALRSLMEELEAVDWYDQRVAATGDGELADILAHNRDEEKEHAAMVIEWLRRRDAKFDEHLRTYLFTEGDILEIEEEVEGGAGPSDGPPHEPDHSLRIGSLRGEVSL